jgi:phosphoribosylpyrophosphate synthetase
LNPILFTSVTVFQERLTAPFATEAVKEVNSTGTVPRERNAQAAALEVVDLAILIPSIEP